MKIKISQKAAAAFFLVVIGLSSPSTAQSDKTLIESIGIYECISEMCFEVPKTEPNCDSDDQRCLACKKVCSQTFTSCMASASNPDQEKHCQEQYDECAKTCVTSNKVRLPLQAVTKLECRVTIVRGRTNRGCTWNNGSTITLTSPKTVRISVFLASNVTVDNFILENSQTGAREVYNGNLNGTGQAKRVPAGTYRILYNWTYVIGDNRWPKTFQAMVR
jgi:hypothetical protein